PARLAAGRRPLRCEPRPQERPVGPLRLVTDVRRPHSGSGRAARPLHREGVPVKFPRGIRPAAIWILAAALLVSTVWASCEREHAAAATARADSLAADAAAERLRADGWAATFGEATSS